METLVIGNGGLGRAIAAACRERGYPDPRVLGRPPGDRHVPASLGPADVAFEATRGEAVVANVQALIDAGCHRLVIGTTGWESDRSRVEAILRAAGAAAVAAPNFSLAAAVFLRVVEEAATLFGALGRFDPYIVEWHRRTKLDRPSGTARELARRIIAASQGSVTVADGRPGRPPQPAELEVASVRAGSNPGTHLVGFDGPGEAVELKLIARDRVAYADGALAAAAWLMAAPRAPGLHAFDAVVDALLDPPTVAVLA